MFFAIISHLFPAAFSPTFARARFAPLLATTSSAFFSATFIRFVYGRPCAAFRFFAANATFFITLLDIVSLPLLLGVYFFLLPRAIGPPSKQTDFADRSDLVPSQD